MNFESLLHPEALLFYIGFLFGLASPQMQNRRKMMICKFLGDSFLGIYLFFIGGYSGGCGAIIASSGALIQALTPLKHLQKTITLRIGIATILSLASIYFVYRTPIDLLPLSMVIVCRFGELQRDSQRIRIVYFLTCFPWMLYHYLNGFYLPLFACGILSISLLTGIYRHHLTHVRALAKEQTLT